MLDPITGAEAAPETLTLAEALAQRQAMQKLLWAGVLGSLRPILDKLNAAALSEVAQELRAVLPYLPDGQNKMALTNLANIIVAAPQVVQEAIVLGERESV